MIPALILAALSLPTLVARQAVTREAVGPSRCVRCHPAEALWWQTVDGPPPKGHLNALAQLESADGQRYAQRLGVKDVFDPAGRCVGCHATVFRGAAREGVSCESCHGAGSGYLDVHAEPGAYRLGVSAGMTDMIGDVKAWSARCLRCHFVVDSQLTAAGHSSGKAFDLADKYRVVERHWKRTFPADIVAVAAKATVAAMTTQAHER